MNEEEKTAYFDCLADRDHRSKADDQMGKIETIFEDLVFWRASLVRVIKDKYWWQARRKDEKEFAEVQEKVNKPLFDEGGNALKFGEDQPVLQLGDAENEAWGK